MYRTSSASVTTWQAIFARQGNHNLNPFVKRSLNPCAIWDCQCGSNTPIRTRAGVVACGRGRWLVVVVVCMKAPRSESLVCCDWCHWQWCGGRWWKVPVDGWWLVTVTGWWTGGWMAPGGPSLYCMAWWWTGRSSLLSPQSPHRRLEGPASASISPTNVRHTPCSLLPL
jgi:hypothetical protein